MTKKASTLKTTTPTAPTEPKKKLSRKEKDEAFRLMNENWAKAMDLYFADLDKENADLKGQRANANAQRE